MRKKTAQQPSDDSSDIVEEHVFTKSELDDMDAKQQADEKPLKKEGGKHVKKDESPADKIERELTEIYENPDGSLPDMKSFDKKKGGRVIKATITLVLSLAFLGSAMWYGYQRVFLHTGSFVEDDVILSIGGEDTVGFGEEVRYRVRFKNAQAVPIDSAELEVRYPAGFVYDSASRDPDEGSINTWTLGNLTEDDGEYIDIIGHLYADVGESQSFRVFLNYSPSNFSSTFQKVATQETTIGGAPIAIHLDGPQSVSQGIRAPFTIDVSPDEQGSGQLPPHLALVFVPGTAFVNQSMEPSSENQKENLWYIEPPTVKTTYTIAGAFAGGDETLTPHAELIGWRDGQTIDDAYTLASSEKSLTISGEQLAVSLVVNGSQSDISVQPGETLSTTVVIKNNTEDTLKDVRVRMRFDAPAKNNTSILDWATLVDENNGLIQGEKVSDTLRRGIITWSGQNIAGLRSLAPGDQVSIDVALPVKSNEDTDLSSYAAYEISVESEAQYQLDGTEETAAASPLLLTLNSDATLDVRDDIDSSTHTMTWIISNSFHPLNNIEAKVDFYGDIDFDPADAVVPAGEIAYDEKEQQLVWNIDEMPLSVDVLVLQFPVTLKKQNESQTQLTSKVTVTATDSTTEKGILLIGNEIGLQ